MTTWSRRQKFNLWEKGSHLKEYTYKVTGGTDKYDGPSGGGTFYDSLTDTLFAGTFKDTITVP
jgi:hypothetical protein